MNTTDEGMTDAMLFETVSQEAANVFGADIEGIKALQENNDAVAIVVSVLIKLGGDEREIARFFNKDTAWVDRLKNKGDSLERDSRYELVYDSSQSALMAMSALGAPASQPPLQKVVAQSHELPERVLVVVSKHTHLDRQVIMENRDYPAAKARALCAKVLVLMGMSAKNVGAFFSKSSAWCSQIKLDPETERITHQIKASLNGEEPRTVIPVTLPVEVVVEPEEAPTETLQDVNGLAEKVFNTFCSPAVLFLENPTAEVKRAQEVLVYLSVGTMPFTSLLSTFKLSEQDAYIIIGRTTVRAREDLSFAKKIKQLHKS